MKEISSTTSVEDESENIPQEFLLYQNYPNPFNPSTAIRFSMQREHVTLKIFDGNRREVAILVDRELNREHSVVFPAEGWQRCVFLSINHWNICSTKKMEVMR